MLLPRPWMLLLAWAIASSSAHADTAPAPTLAYYTVPAHGNGTWTQQEAKVEAVRHAFMAAQVPGTVQALAVQAGERVSAGQTLLRIDARMAQQGAAASQAQVVAAQAQLAVARKEYERQQQLFAQRYISQAALDSAQAQWRSAQAQVQALQAQAQAAATQSGLHVVQAPFAGVVASVAVSVGDMAMPGSPLLTMYDPSALRVTAQVAENLAQALRPSPALQLALPGQAPLTIAAGQVQVLPAADPLSHTVTVRIPLPPETSKTQGVVPGMFARILLPSSSAPTVATTSTVHIPRSALVQRAELTGVYVQGRNGQPQLRQIRTGQVLGDTVEVLSGVRPGERIATAPNQAARLAQPGPQTPEH